MRLSPAVADAARTRASQSNVYSGTGRSSVHANSVAGEARRMLAELEDLDDIKEAVPLFVPSGEARPGTLYYNIISSSYKNYMFFNLFRILFQ